MNAASRSNGEVEGPRDHARPGDAGAHCPQAPAAPDKKRPTYIHTVRCLFPREIAVSPNNRWSVCVCVVSRQDRRRSRACPQAPGVTAAIA